MIAALLLALVLACSLPALLPRWDHVGIGVAAVVTAVVAATVFLLRDLEAHPSGGDGPAFFGLVFLFGAALILVVGSVLGRVLIHAVVCRFSARTHGLAAAALLTAGALPLALLGVASLVEPTLVSFASVVFVLSYPLLWLGAAVKLAPNNSYMDSPRSTRN